MLLDALIIILVIGVIATLVVPYLRTEKSVEMRETCRIQMKNWSEAQLKYFDTAGGKYDPQAAAAAAESLKAELEKSKKKGKKIAPADTVVIVRTFTKDLNELRKFLPDGSDTSVVCPLDGREFIVIARDSFFYSISCPNGHGQVIMGSATWEGD